MEVESPLDLGVSSARLRSHQLDVDDECALRLTTTMKIDTRHEVLSNNRSPSYSSVVDTTSGSPQPQSPDVETFNCWRQLAAAARRSVDIVDRRSNESTSPSVVVDCRRWTTSPTSRQPRGRRSTSSVHSEASSFVDASDDVRSDNDSVMELRTRRRSSIAIDAPSSSARSTPDIASRSVRPETEMAPSSSSPPPPVIHTSVGIIPDSLKRRRCSRSPPSLTKMSRDAPSRDHQQVIAPTSRFSIANILRPDFGTSGGVAETGSGNRSTMMQQLLTVRQSASQIRHQQPMLHPYAAFYAAAAAAAAAAMAEGRGAVMRNGVRHPMQVVAPVVTRQNVNVTPDQFSMFELAASRNVINNNNNNNNNINVNKNKNNSHGARAELRDVSSDELYDSRRKVAPHVAKSSVIQQQQQVVAGVKAAARTAQLNKLLNNVDHTAAHHLSPEQQQQQRRPATAVHPPPPPPPVRPHSPARLSVHSSSCTDDDVDGSCSRGSTSAAAAGQAQQADTDGKGSLAPLPWPAWVYCTRYSDRPSSGPRTRKAKKKDLAASLLDEKRPRTAFTASQLERLKREFEDSKYLTEERRQSLAKELALNESQIKIWFQNKRAKMKKASGVRNQLALQLMAQGLYNHSSAVHR